jgi:ABC-type amino acid transport system permease subunit
MPPAQPQQIPRWVGASPLVAVLAAIIYAAAEDFTAKSSATFWSVLALCLATAAAALIVGALVGFLFGFPRTSEKSEQTGLLETNTNLDQISDWLTKILVGLGLVQIGKIAHGINALASALAPGLGEGAGAKPFAVGLLVYSAVDGFLLGYLWARTVVSRLFREAAEDLSRKLATQQVALEAKLQDEVLSAPPPQAPPPLPPPPP